MLVKSIKKSNCFFCIKKTNTPSLILLGKTLQNQPVHKCDLAAAVLSYVDIFPNDPDYTLINTVDLIPEAEGVNLQLILTLAGIVQ